MTLLATIDAVKVTRRRARSKLTTTDYPDGYAETYTSTPRPASRRSSSAASRARRPSVTVDYDIKRVTAANWADAAA